MLTAVLGGGFLQNAHGQLDPLSYFFGAGIATNIGAALVGVILGVVWSRTKYWPLRAVHARLDALHASHAELHAKLDRHAATAAAHAEAIRQLDRRVIETARAATPARLRGGRA